jgi:mannose-6-phosphate isomerase-like protein (cupin superfamily)
MRIALLLSCSLLIASLDAQTRGAAPPAQTPAPAPAQPPAQPPATTPAPRPPARRPAAPSAAVTARTGLAIVVTNPQGTPLSGIRISLTGPSDRSGTTDTMGQLRVTGLQMGTYRLRFAGDEVVTFEREVAVRSGQTSDIDVTLTAAPPPPAPPPPPPPPPAAAPEPRVGPAGQPQAPSLVDYLDRNLIRNNEPRKETLVSCSGNTRTMLVQMNQDQPRRVYDGAEVTYYVIAGEGSAKFDARETPLAAGTFVSVPRDTGHELLRRGRRPLIVLAQINGEPCDEAK